MVLRQKRRMQMSDLKLGRPLLPLRPLQAEEQRKHKEQQEREAEEKKDAERRERRAEERRRLGLPTGDDHGAVQQGGLKGMFCCWGKSPFGF